MNERLLPDGLAVEPPGWRDEHGLSPIDALNGYLADRFELETWASAELRKVDRRGGAGTDADYALDQQIRARFRDLRTRHLSASALARAKLPAYQSPSDHDPDRNRIVKLARRRRGKVAITVEYRMPKGYLPAGLDTSIYRYDFVVDEGVWRLDNRLAMDFGRPIGGLY